MAQAEATHPTMAAGDHGQEDVIAFLSNLASYSGVQRVDRQDTRTAAGTARRSSARCIFPRTFQVRDCMSAVGTAYAQVGQADHGAVLADNTAMLRMCRELGFVWNPNRAMRACVSLVFNWVDRLWSAADESDDPGRSGAGSSIPGYPRSRTGSGAGSRKGGRLWRLSNGPARGRWRPDGAAPADHPRP